MHQEDEGSVASSSLKSDADSPDDPGKGEYSEENPAENSSDQSVPDSSSTQVLDALGAVTESLGTLQTLVDKFHERSSAHEDLVRRMQQRVDDLQRDQIRALLGPVYEELVSLHADLAEIADRDRIVVHPDRLGKELNYLVARVDAALEHLGLESVEAAPGVPFDSRLHSAARRVPTGSEALDQTIERVHRQGYMYPGAAKTSLHARVTVYSYDAQLNDTPTPGQAPAELVAEPVGDAPHLEELPRPGTDSIPLPVSNHSSGS